MVLWTELTGAATLVEHAFQGSIKYATFQVVTGVIMYSKTQEAEGNKGRVALFFCAFTLVLTSLRVAFHFHFLLQ